MSKKIREREEVFNQMFKKLVECVSDNLENNLEMKECIEDLYNKYDNVDKLNKIISELYDKLDETKTDVKFLAKELADLKRENAKLKFFIENPKGYTLKYESDLPFTPPSFAYYYHDKFYETSLEDVIEVLDETDKYFILEAIFPIGEEEFIKFVPKDKLCADFKETNIIKLNKLSGEYVDITKEWKEKEQLKTKLNRKSKEKE